MSENIQLGLLLERNTLTKYKYIALINLLENHDCDIKLVAINEEKNKNSGLRREQGKVSYLISKLIKNEPYVLVEADRYIGEKLGFKSEAELSNWQQKENIDHIIEKSDKVLHYKLKSVGDVCYEVPDDVVDEFAESVDVLLNFEHAILKGRILSAVEHGPISFHGADIRRYRGRPPIVWQYLNNENVLGRTLQELTPELDGGKPIIIDHYRIKKTDTYWDLKLANRKELAPHLLNQGIEKICIEGYEPKALNKLGELTHSSDKQKWHVVLQILAKNWLRRGRKILKALSG